MRVLLIGKQGQVGWELHRALMPLGHVSAVGREGVDLANPDSIQASIRQANPSVIVNAAAYTAVDQAEGEAERAHLINAVAPGLLAEQARERGVLLVHYSTDYVFDGTQQRPYTETDEPNPLNEYGRSKLAGERAIQDAECAHLIFRTSWVYGNRGRNFLCTMLRLGRERDELNIVNDQTGAPTWSRLIAQASALATYRYLGAKERGEDLGGLYHLSNAGQTSWYGFAQAIFAGVREAGEKLCVRRVAPITTQEYPTPALRPAFSVLNSDKLAAVFGLRLPPWEQALRLCLEEREA